jgi:drug/metabolite transporter (DMT)-like permease
LEFVLHPVKEARIVTDISECGGFLLLNDGAVVSRTRISLIKLIMGSACISFAPILIKLSGLSPDIAGFYRMFFAAVSLAALRFFHREKAIIGRISLRYLVIGSLFLSLDFMCWHRSIALVGPGLSTLLANFQVFFTAVFSYFFLKQHIRWKFILAVPLAITGLILITGTSWESISSGTQHGILLGLTTAVFYSGYILFLRGGMSNSLISGTSAMWVVSVSCAIFLGSISLIYGASFSFSSVRSFLAIAGVGVLGTTLGWSLISSGVKDIPPTITGLVLLLQPTLAFVWDVVFFSRPLGMHEFIGIVVILSAIYLGSYRK